MRNIFIDCGAWTGDSVLEFVKHFKDYEIYAFECHPLLQNQLKNLSEKHNFNLIDKAVWINDEPMKLYLGVNDLTQSSTLFSNKKKYIDKKKPVEVQSIDFSKWIKDNFSPDDNIVCKMNIEGAEYDILEKMINDKTIKYIKRLYCAWHYNKLEGFPKKRHDKLHKQLSKLLDLRNWHYDEKVGENPY